MPEMPFDRQERGFAFTEEDYARRYPSGEPRAAKPHPAPAAASPTPLRATRLHGGGNSFMRARRRRLAASASAERG